MVGMLLRLFVLSCGMYVLYLFVCMWLSSWYM